MQGARSPQPPWAFKQIKQQTHNIIKQHLRGHSSQRGQATFGARSDLELEGSPTLRIQRTQKASTRVRATTAASVGKYDSRARYLSSYPIECRGQPRRQLQEQKYIRAGRLDPSATASSLFHAKKRRAQPRTPRGLAKSLRVSGSQLGCQVRVNSGEGDLKGLEDLQVACARARALSVAGFADLFLHMPAEVAPACFDVTHLGRPVCTCQAAS